MDKQNYIARKKCGCICGSIYADAGKSFVAQSVAEWIRKGLTVELTTLEKCKVDPLWFPSTCPHMKAEASK